MVAMGWRAGVASVTVMARVPAPVVVMVAVTSAGCGLGWSCQVIPAQVNGIRADPAGVPGARSAACRTASSRAGWIACPAGARPWGSAAVA